MAGEVPILDVTFDNVTQVNFQPYAVCVLDGTNSGPMTTGAAAAPTSGNPTPLGVVMDKAKLDMTGTPVKSSGVTVRVMGVAKVVADAAVAVGDRVVCATGNAGRVISAVKATAGNVPMPCLGIAWTQATAQLDRILVLLTPGGMY